jgi:hypothetical protein
MAHYEKSLILLIMRQFNLDSELNDRKYLREQFCKFEKQAIQILNKLYETFTNNLDIKTFDFNDNSFKFILWGQNFIVKAEISYSEEFKSFKEAELNTYLVIKEDETLILSYMFDYLGNINRVFQKDQFSEYYYSDFILKIIEYTSKMNIKFRL